MNDKDFEALKASVVDGTFWGGTRRVRLRGYAQADELWALLKLHRPAEQVDGVHYPLQMQAWEGGTKWEYWMCGRDGMTYKMVPMPDDHHSAIDYNPKYPYGCYGVDIEVYAEERETLARWAKRNAQTGASPVKADGDEKAE